jgi:hypothetical protein
MGLYDFFKNILFGRRTHAALCLAALLLLYPACTLEQLFPEKVADGAARLSIANLGALLKFLSTDTECGFQNSEVLKSVKIVPDKNAASHGKATYELKKNCTIDFDARCNGPCLVKDCGVTTSLSGRVTIGHATQVRIGQITEPENPATHTAASGQYAVIPTGNDAIEIAIKNIHFDKFAVTSSTRKEHMVMLSGSASMNVSVHLAESRSSDGLCIVPVPNITINRIALNNIEARMPGASGQFSVPLHGVLKAQYGKYRTLENVLKGKISVWGEQIAVPSDKKGLDPGYSQEQFNKELECIKDIKLPLSYKCDFDRFFALTVTRLLFFNLGTLVRESSAEVLTPKKDRCAFSAIDTNIGPTELKQLIKHIKWEHRENKIGRTEEGITTFSLKSPCPLGTKKRGQIHGVYCPVGEAKKVSETYIEGLATIEKGSMTTEGRTRNVFGPYAYAEPNAPENVTIHLDKVRVDSFSSYFKDSDESSERAKLVLTSGVLGAVVKPVLAGDKEHPNVFIRPTPVVLFENVNVKKLKGALYIHKPSDIEPSRNAYIILPLEIDVSHLSAQNGFYKGRGNWLEGSITINGKSMELHREKLDPDYDQHLFDESYACWKRDFLPSGVKNPAPISDIIGFQEGWQSKAIHNGG